jgi:hypothetical protein
MGHHKRTTRPFSILLSPMIAAAAMAPRTTKV